MAPAAPKNTEVPFLSPSVDPGKEALVTIRRRDTIMPEQEVPPTTAWKQCVWKQCVWKQCENSGVEGISMPEK